MDPSLSPLESPPLRSTILPSFLRRPRVTTTTTTNTTTISTPTPGTATSSASQQTRDSIYLYEDIMPPTLTQIPSHSSDHRRRPVTSSVNGILSSASAAPASSASVGLTQILRRRRSVGTPNGHTIPTNALNARSTSSSSSSVGKTTHRIRLVPHIDSRRALRFEPISRDLRESDPALRIGRFTDRSGSRAGLNTHNSSNLAFKSKVVSRAHAEVWVDPTGKWLIKDTKSSSGTFLNHVRLSTAGQESKPHQLKDGDILQLGVDYQGGAEDMYKSVKIRVELGREWQAVPNVFNTNALKNLKSLAVIASPSASTKSKAASKSTIPDCCICLFAVTIRQALFIAPCSHTFHYKCIKPLLDSHHPAFSCPLCRSFADLDEDVEVELPESDYALLANGDNDYTDHHSDNHNHGGGGSGSGSDNEGGATPTPQFLALPPSQGAAVAPPDATEREGADTDVEGDGATGGVVHGPYVPRHTRAWAHRLDAGGNGGSSTLFVLPPSAAGHDPVVDLTAGGVFTDAPDRGSDYVQPNGLNDVHLEPLSDLSDSTMQMSSPAERDAVLMDVDSGNPSSVGDPREADALALVTLDLLRGEDLDGEGRTRGRNVVLPHHHAEGSGAGLFEFGVGVGLGDEIVEGGEGMAGGKRKRISLAMHTL